MPELLPAVQDHVSLATTLLATYIQQFILKFINTKILSAHTFKVTVLHDKHAAGKASMEGTRKTSGRRQNSGTAIKDHGET